MWTFLCSFKMHFEYQKLLRTGCTALCLTLIRPTRKECLKAQTHECCSSFFSEESHVTPASYSPRYKATITKKRVCVILGLCWLLSVLVGLVPLMGWNQHTGGSSYIECHFLAVMRKDYVVYFSFFTWILLPSIIMCTLYAKIFHIMRTKLSQNSARLPDGGTVYPKAYKTAKYMALLLFLFAVSWLPLGILNCVLHFCPSCTIPRSLVYLSILLSHANSAMNPAVYAFKIEKFKETCTFILRTYFLFQNSELVISSAEHTAEQTRVSVI